MRAGQAGHLRLHGGVAAGVDPGVVVGEAVHHLRVGGQVAEQAGGAVIDAPLAGVERVAHAGGLAVVLARPGLGEVHADLHRARGGDRVQLGQAAHVEQLAGQVGRPEGARVGALVVGQQVAEDEVEIPLGADLLQPLLEGAGSAGARAASSRRNTGRPRGPSCSWYFSMRASTTLARPGHHRVVAKARLLGDERHDRADRRRLGVDGCWPAGHRPWPWPRPAARSPSG